MSIYKGSTLIATTNTASLSYDTDEKKLILENSVGTSSQVQVDTSITTGSDNLVTSNGVKDYVDAHAPDISATLPIKAETTPAGYQYRLASTYDSTATYYVKVSGNTYTSVGTIPEYVFNSAWYTYDSGTDTYIACVSTDTFDSSLTYYIEEGGTYSVAPVQPTAQTWFTSFYTRVNVPTPSTVISAEIDNAPVANSTKLVTSGGVHQAILEASPNIVGTSPIDVVATVDPVTGVTTNTISADMDTVPTADSTKLVSSGAIKQYVDEHAPVINGVAPIVATTVPAGTITYSQATTYASGTNYYYHDSLIDTYTQTNVPDAFVFETNFYIENYEESIGLTEETFIADPTHYYTKQPNDTYTQCSASDTFDSGTTYYVLNGYRHVTQADSFNASLTYYTYDETTIQYSVAANPPTSITWYQTWYTQNAPTSTPSTTISADIHGTDVSYNNTNSGLAATEVQSAIDELKTDIDNIPTPITPKGSIEFANLPSLASAGLGDMYNIEDAFTTTSDFVEGAGVDYGAGTNVYCIEVTGGTKKWDVFGGEMPIATTTQLGVVKPDGATIEVSSGEISVSDSFKKIFIGTQAEWNTLSLAEKTAYDEADLSDGVAGGELIVSDTITEGDLNPVTSNAVAKAVNYSTDEVKTGATWIDGKPIYRHIIKKTVSFTGNSWNGTDISLSTVDTLCDCKMLSGKYACSGYYTRKNNSDLLEVFCVSDANWSASMFILEYTKI